MWSYSIPSYRFFLLLFTLGNVEWQTTFVGDGAYALLLGSVWYHCTLPDASIAMATIIIIRTLVSNLRPLCNTHVMCLMWTKFRCIFSVLHSFSWLHPSIRKPVRKVKTHIILYQQLAVQMIDPDDVDSPGHHSKFHLNYDTKNSSVNSCIMKTSNLSWQNDSIVKMY